MLAFLMSSSMGIYRNKLLGIVFLGIASAEDITDLYLVRSISEMQRYQEKHTGETVPNLAFKEIDSGRLFQDLSTLEEVWDFMKLLVPNRGTNGYNPPTEQIVADFERIVLDMMTIGHPPFHRSEEMSDDKFCNGSNYDRDGNQLESCASLYSPPRSCREISLRSLKGMYQIGTFVDRENRRSYCLLTTTSMAYPWGNVFVDMDSSRDTKNLSFDCPHPKYDAETGEQGIRLLKGTNSRSWIVSGSHRMANDQNLGSCQPQYSHYPSDAAHSVDNCFLAAVSAIQFYYQSIVHQDYTSVQLHGMGEATCGNIDTFFSHGSCSESVSYEPNFPDSNEGRKEKIELLQKVAMAHPHDSGKHAIAKGDESGCHLCGSTNIQGRFINGVKRKDLCDTFASSYNGRFIQIEQKRDYRRAAHAQFWNDVFNEAYPQFLALSKPVDNQLSLK